jgi:hypothetical protein
MMPCCEVEGHPFPAISLTVFVNAVEHLDLFHSVLNKKNLFHFTLKKHELTHFNAFLDQDPLKFSNRIFFVRFGHKMKILYIFFWRARVFWPLPLLMLPIFVWIRTQKAAMARGALTT